MSSLKETIEKFSVTDSWNGSEYVYVEDIPGIVVSALQGIADQFRGEAKAYAEISNHSDYYTMCRAVYVVESHQRSIVQELM